MPLLIFIVGVLCGLFFRLPTHNSKGQIIVQIQDTQKVKLTVVGLDSNGTRDKYPDGTNYAWGSVVDTNGEGSGVFTVDPNDPASGELAIGVGGTSGSIEVAVTMPDGTTVTVPAFTFDAIAGPIVSGEIVAGTPENQ